MSIIISDELQQLFDLRDHRASMSEKLTLAEVELRTNTQQNSRKDFVEIHDLDITHKLMRAVSEAKHEFDAINHQYEIKKKFFINLLESSGRPVLACTNKEWNADGDFEYIPYKISIVENEDGETDLLMEAEHSME